MLAHDGIIFVEHHLLGDVARVLFRHVIEARVGSRDEFDLDGCGLRHRGFLKSHMGHLAKTNRAALTHAAFQGAQLAHGCK